MISKAFIAIILVICTNSFAQMRHPVTSEVLAIPTKGDILLESGNFNNYEASFGIIHHMDGVYGLQFVAIERDTLQPWLVILNGGPGRSNLRLSFEIDSLLNNYNILLPGYRGFDDAAYTRVFSKGFDTIMMFVEHHKKIFANNRVAEDVLLILKSLHSSKCSVLAHSYGTIIGRKMLEIDPFLIDTVYAFSPVCELYPYPEPSRIECIVNLLADTLSIPIVQVHDTLKNWMISPHRSKLIMGMVSSFYRYAEGVAFFSSLFNGELSRQDIIRKGETYVQRDWLFDYALKFSVVSPYIESEHLYNQISDVFIKSIGVYNLADVVQPVPSNLQINHSKLKLYLPTFELFVTYADTLAESIVCDCFHADIWHLAPNIILNKERKKSLSVDAN